MLAAHPAPFEGRRPTKAEFQEWFEQGTDRWTGGEHDDEYDESFAVFGDRVEQALGRVVETSASGTAIVVTSGGPVARTAASLLADRPTCARGCGDGSTRCA